MEDGEIVDSPQQTVQASKQDTNNDELANDQKEALARELALQALMRKQSNKARNKPPVASPKSTPPSNSTPPTNTNANANANTTKRTTSSSNRWASAHSSDEETNTKTSAKTSTKTSTKTNPSQPTPSDGDETKKRKSTTTTGTDKPTIQPNSAATASERAAKRMKITDSSDSDSDTTKPHQKTTTTTKTKSNNNNDNVAPIPSGDLNDLDDLSEFPARDNPPHSNSTTNHNNNNNNNNNNNKNNNKDTNRNNGKNSDNNKNNADNEDNNSNNNHDNHDNNVDQHSVGGTVEGNKTAENGDVEEEADPAVRSPDVERIDPLLRCALHGCRSVECYEKLNKIDEGTYGVVFRAKDNETGEIVALKQIKMAKEKEGFPITALREITTLLNIRHKNIVQVKEVVIGSSLDKIFMVMEYMEHDIKALMDAMSQPFSQSEVKCLMLQLLGAVEYMHRNWVIHRDLKTSNLLMDNQGTLKVCDFGLARKYGSPVLRPYTGLVVTLWYRAPELLLGEKSYTTAVDVWSVGCIFAELLSRQPLFPAKTELEELDKIFKTLGTPSEATWPGFKKLPNAAKIRWPNHAVGNLREKFPRTCTGGAGCFLSELGFDLLLKMLTYCPEQRITAAEALNHPYFSEAPKAKDPRLMPTFPESHKFAKSKQ